MLLQRLCGYKAGPIASLDHPFVLYLLERTCGHEKIGTCGRSTPNSRGRSTLRCFNWTLTFHTAGWTDSGKNCKKDRRCDVASVSWQARSQYQSLSDGFVWKKIPLNPIVNHHRANGIFYAKNHFRNTPTCCAKCCSTDPQDDNVNCEHS